MAADQHTAPESAPGTAAFFDLDNTLIQGAAMFHLARGMYARRFFTARDLGRFAWRQAWFRVRAVEHMGHVADVQREGLALIAGHRTAELRAMVEEIFDEHLSERIWPGTRALAQAHLDRGQQVWIVSAAPVECAETIAARLGLTGALGTVSEIEDGVYTGRLHGAPLHGPAKADAVQRLMAEEGLRPADCAGYSDSFNDLPLLSLVGHPCAVNPDAALRRHAREMGWPVRDFRTARKAVKVGVPVAVGAGAAAGAAALAARLRRPGRR